MRGRKPPIAAVIFMMLKRSSFDFIQYGRFGSQHILRTAGSYVSLQMRGAPLDSKTVGVFLGLWFDCRILGHRKVVQYLFNVWSHKTLTPATSCCDLWRVERAGSIKLFKYHRFSVWATLGFRSICDGRSQCVEASFSLSPCVLFGAG